MRWWCGDRVVERPEVPPHAARSVPGPALTHAAASASGFVVGAAVIPASLRQRSTVRRVTWYIWETAAAVMPRLTAWVLVIRAPDEWDLR
jgi:hypothetical protein